MPVECVAVDVVAGTADAQGVSGYTILYGYSVTETAGTPAAAEVILRNGTSTAGGPVAHVKLAASGTLVAPTGEVGTRCQNGIFVDRVSGDSHVILLVG